jgi:transposase
MGRRNEYLEKMKKNLVREALSGGNSSFVARKHGIHPGTLKKWVKEYRDEVEFQMDKQSSTTPNLPNDSDSTDYKKMYEKAVTLLGEKDLEIAILKDLVKKTTPRSLKG